MRRLICAAAIVISLAATASAGHLSFKFGIGSDSGGFEFHGRHGGLLDGGFFGFGLFGGLGTEFRQTRFENQFEDIQSEYDSGLADIEDYYNSDNYADVIGDAERLVDRYDWFLTGVERSIDRLGDVIELAGERQTFLTDLLADYQERDDLSEERLERIERWITTTQDFLSLKVDLLTERQTTLQEGLVDYQAFQTDVTTYLDEIVTAGGGTTDATGLKTNSASAMAMTLVEATEGATSCNPAPLIEASISPMSEPTSAGLAGLLLVMLGATRRITGRDCNNDAMRMVQKR